MAWNHRYGRARYRYQGGSDIAYRRAKRKLLSIVHAINRKPLSGEAGVFDGLM